MSSATSKQETKGWPVPFLLDNYTQQEKKLENTLMNILTI